MSRTYIGQKGKNEMSDLFEGLPADLKEEAKKRYVKPNYDMVDGFGRDIDEALYWRNTGLSQESIAEIKAYKRQKALDAKSE